MPFRPLGKKALPKRSRAMLIKLAYKTCLRCLKRIFDNPIYRYRYKDFQKYIAYIYKYKDYNPIKTYLAVTTPSLLIVVVNFSKIRLKS
jgi:hypothetical protein